MSLSGATKPATSIGNTLAFLRQTLELQSAAHVASTVNEFRRPHPEPQPSTEVNASPDTDVTLHQITPFNADAVFPTELPPEYTDKIVLIDNKFPTILLTKDLLSKFKNAVIAIDQHERLEVLDIFDIEERREQVQDLDKGLAKLRVQKAQAEKIIQKFRDDNKEGICPISAAEMERLDGAFATDEENRQKWLDADVDNSKHTRESLLESWLQQRELALDIAKCLQSSNLSGNEKERWVATRRHIAKPVRQMYRRHTDYQERVRGFVDEDWAANDKGEERVRHPSERSGYSSALNELEMRHWKKRVAEDDFENRSNVRLLRRKGLWEQRKKDHHEREKKFKDELGPRPKRGQAFKKRIIKDFKDREAIQFKRFKEQLDNELLLEQVQIMKDLTEAQQKYRHAKRRMRALGASVPSYDSTHLSEPSTQAPSHTLSTEMNNFRVQRKVVETWKDTVLASAQHDDAAVIDAPASPPPPSSSSSSSSSETSRSSKPTKPEHSIEIHESYSAKGGWGGLGEHMAAAARAYKRLQEFRDKDAIDGVKDKKRAAEEDAEVPLAQKRQRKETRRSEKEIREKDYKIQELLVGSFTLAGEVPQVNEVERLRPELAERTSDDGWTMRADRKNLIPAGDPAYASRTELEGIARPQRDDLMMGPFYP